LKNMEVLSYLPFNDNIVQRLSNPEQLGRH
jgi:hypothetical protein